MDRDESEVHKLAKKGRGQYPAILPEQAWSIKDLLYGIRYKLQRNFSCGTKRVIPSEQDRGSQSQHGIWFILPAHGATHIINCVLGRDTTLISTFIHQRILRQLDRILGKNLQWTSIQSRGSSPGLLRSIFAGYVPLASQIPSPHYSLLLV